MTNYFTRLCLLLTLFAAPVTPATSIFVNELHYDNVGGDVDEGIEIAAAAGTDLGSLQLVLYNGSNGMGYAQTVLEGVVPDQHNGFGTLFFAIAGIQNGPDGIVLATLAGEVLQFLSYEGTFMATGGVAAGMTSTDIGVFESPDTDPDASLQLIGSGAAATDFTWTLAAASRGLINAGQEFTTPVPLPGPMFMLLSALAGLFACRRQSGCSPQQRENHVQRAPEVRSPFSSAPDLPVRSMRPFLRCD